MISLPFIGAWFIMVMLGVVGHQFHNPKLFISYWATFALSALLLISVKLLGYIFRKR